MIYTKNYINKLIKKIVINIKKTDVWQTYKWKKFDRITRKYEDKFIDEIRPLFIQQQKEVLANLKKTPKAYIGKQNVDSWLFSKKDWEKRFEAKNKDLVEGIAIDYGNRSLDELDIIGVAFDVNNPEVQKFIKNNGVVFGQKTQDTAYENLKTTLIAGIDAGEGIPELAKRVRGIYEGYIDDFEPWKTRRIARTEVIKASNVGALNSYKQSGVVIGKIWLSTKDDRTRGQKKNDTQDHVNMNDQRVKIDEKFVDPLSGEQLDFPGDPSANVAAIIN